jgi:hypothetical protein
MSEPEIYTVAGRVSVNDPLEPLGTIKCPPDDFPAALEAIFEKAAAKAFRHIQVKCDKCDIADLTPDEAIEIANDNGFDRVTMDLDADGNVVSFEWSQPRSPAA